MPAKVEVSALSGAKAWCEVSGGSESTVSNGSREFGVGASGSMVSMLTVRRESPGTISIKAVSGKLAVELDGNHKSPKKLSAGKTLKFSARNERALVKERV